MESITHWHTPNPYGIDSKDDLIAIPLPFSGLRLVHLLLGEGRKWDGVWREGGGEGVGLFLCISC